MAEREGFIAVVGGRVWYRVVGEGPGIPLLTLHGGPGATHDLLEPLAALGDERPIVFYDQLGGGRSDRPEDVTLWRVERFVQELGQVREHLGLARLHLLGHSWGSMLATDYALTRPPGLVSLVLASPPLSIPRWMEDAERLRRHLPPEVEATLRRHEAAGTTDSEEYWQATLVYYRRHLTRLDPLPEALQRAIAGFNQAVYATMWGASEFFITGNLVDYDRTARLREISLPTLFTCGRYDEATPASTAWYQSLVPGAELTIFEESAHTPQFEEPERFLGVVRDFLRRAERAPGSEHA